jgi:hypothetical protein
VSISIDFVVNGSNVNSHFKQLEDVPIVMRNRDWTPVFDGFKFGLGSKVPSVPQKNHLVLVAVDSDNHFLGYIDRLPFVNSEKLYEFEVKNFLMKLEKYRIRWDTLHSLLNNTADFTGAKSFTVDTSTDRLLCTGHGLNDGDVIQVKSTGTLPTPLEENTYYWIRIYDGDIARLYSDHGDWLSGTPVINFTDTGSGTHTFALADYEKYIGARDPFNVNSAATLKWITENIFALIGVVLDTSLVDDIIFHKFTIGSEYTWKWNEIYLDENMMYCLNQNVAIHHDYLDNTEYLDNQITCLQFIQDLFGKLGFAIKFIGDATTKTYLLIPQARDVDGVIEPDAEDYFVVSDSDKINPIDDTLIDDEGGWTHSRNFRTNKADYVSVTPLDLEEYTGKVRTNAGRTQINWWNNLRFYLKDKTTSGTGTSLIDPNTFGYEFYSILYYSARINQTNALLNHSREEMECKADYLSQEKWTVKELKLDIRSKRIKIVQEQNLLASG